MSFRQIDLTTALRPSLLPDETLLFVQDAVGIYEGKYKLPHLQNGQAYLTSHRACYVDHNEPRKNSVAIELKDIERYEFYAGFLKSSPKVTFYFKAPKPSLALYRNSSTILDPPFRKSNTPPAAPRTEPPSRLPSSPAPPLGHNATWICPICSFSNPIPSNFDPVTANAHTPLPPCLACGIKPPLAHVVKAAISDVRNRQSSPALDSPSQPLLESHRLSEGSNVYADEVINSSPAPPERGSGFSCPRCTFLNHPSLSICEICGAPLVSAGTVRPKREGVADYRADSPGPVLNGSIGDQADSVKFSFRGGGERIFYERLKGAMVQRKWLLQGAPPIPKPVRPVSANASSQTSARNAELVQDSPARTRVTGGIAGLERRGQEQRKNNERVIGNAFEDLEALMASAKEVVALAESFAAKVNTTTNAGSSEASTLLSQSASALGLVTTKDMLGSGSSSESLYLSELSRNLAEFLTDDVTGVLRREGGIMSLVDLWAVFNRARGGVELVSPADFHHAAALWEKLKLPVRLRKFKSGLLVVQGREWNDHKIIASLLAWLRELHASIPPGESKWDWSLFGRGITPQETAEKFGWSVGVATEELEMAEDNGAMCREESVEGVRFWVNWITGRDESWETFSRGLQDLSV